MWLEVIIHCIQDTYLSQLHQIGWLINLRTNYQNYSTTGGDKIPRKGGPGITQSDMLIINKTDLAEAVGADLKVNYNAKMFYI